jgi:hypothetical protein
MYNAHEHSGPLYRAVLEALRSNARVRLRVQDVADRYVTATSDVLRAAEHAICCSTAVDNIAARWPGAEPAAIALRIVDDVVRVPASIHRHQSGFLKAADREPP